MKIWLTSLITVSLFLSVISSLLPENGVKRACLTAFGFIFLTVIVTPFFSGTNGFFSKDLLIMESIAETDSSDSDYISRVCDEYKNRLEDECEAMLSQKDYISDVTVGIYENPDKENFGEILFVKCKVFKEGQTKEDNKTHIDKIVISFSGVSVDPKEEKNDNYKDVKRFIADFLGVEKEKVYVES
ncbi:MAG: hypothetical protein E7388_00605 [Ruminococcaceae bacterium]|nr:hypothetical protein [Oscillospiraceae bacterium]